MEIQTNSVIELSTSDHSSTDTILPSLTNPYLIHTITNSHNHPFTSSTDIQTIKINMNHQTVHNVQYCSWNEVISLLKMTTQKDCILMWEAANNGHINVHVNHV